jgi:hypothetical protein
MANTKFSAQEGSNQNMRFLNAKYHTPPKAKANHKLPLIPSQSNQAPTQQRTPTPSEVKNPRFYQMSLDKSQDKHRPLKQQSKSSAYDLGTKATRARIIINDHKQNPFAIHNKKNMDHHSNSSQNRCRNQPTKSHIYTRDEHHDGVNMGHDQGIVTQSSEQIKPHKKQI